MLEKNMAYFVTKTSMILKKLQVIVKGEHGHHTASLFTQLCASNQSITEINHSKIITKTNCLLSKKCFVFKSLKTLRKILSEKIFLNKIKARWIKGE